LEWKTHGHGETGCAFAYEHHVAGVLHHGFRKGSNVFDIANAAY